MRYWHLSTIRTSPLLSPAAVWELTEVYKRLHLSNFAFAACAEVADKTPHAQTGVLVLDSLDAPPRRMYASYPDADDWLALERGAVIEGDNGVLCVLIDALH